MQKTSIKLVKLLQSKGYKAYWAGGCVRDMLLGKEPQDFDIVTNAKPDKIEEIISHTIPVGKQFGVILAVEKGHNFEIATFRSDSGYSDGRRPDAVTFTSAKQDAMRRDFTINGMFYDPIAKKIYDYVNGQKDLEAHLIRFIGVPHERILEDHLRIIRAIRFKNAFQFQYHPDTYKAVKKHIKLADKVSNERLRDEINKMLMSQNNTEAIEDMQDTGVLKVILPEIEAMKGVAQPYRYHKEGDVFDHTMKCLKSLTKNAELDLRWAVLLHDIGKPETFKLGPKRIRFDHHIEEGEKIAKDILKRLKFPRKQMQKIIWLAEHHMMMAPLLKMTKARQRHWFLKPWFKDLMELFKADIAGTTPSDYSLYEKIEKKYKEGLKEVPKEPKKLISGEDVMKILGLKPGKRIGQILERIRHLQLEKKIKTKKEALEWVKGKKK